MAAVLTGRSALKFLHSHGKETTLASLASTFDVDPATVERLVRSLLAAGLICRDSDQIALSQAGLVWCMDAFKPALDAETKPRDEAVPAAGEGWQRSEAPTKSEKPPMARNANRMHGVQVLHVARRRDASAPPANTAPVSPKEPPPARQEPEPAAVPAPETPTASPVVVDQDGFVTEIKGRKIY